jgi:hypothetical protein
MTSFKVPLSFLSLLLAGALALLAGCHSASRPAPVSLQFTRIPPAGEGGPDKVDTIAGRATGLKPGQQIVLFAKADAWWVQPLANQPYTTVQSDGTWSSTTHLGTEYAALVVDPGYQPPAVTGALPSVGGSVIAVATVPGSGGPIKAVITTLHFGGYDWKVRSAVNDRGGVTRSYGPANASVDGKGFLHLRITKRANDWICSEVSLTRSLGFGTYLFSVHDTSKLEAAAALSMFTWSDEGADQNHREMDINLSRWGDPGSKNAEYVVQPYYVPANVSRFLVPSGPLTLSFRWQSGNLSFETTRGATRSAAATPLAAHVFTSGIPAPGEETAHMNFCAFGYAKVPLQHEAEVVIEKFQYLP